MHQIGTTSESLAQMPQTILNMEIDRPKTMVSIHRSFNSKDACLLFEMSRITSDLSPTRSVTPVNINPVRVEETDTIELSTNSNRGILISSFNKPNPTPTKAIREIRRTIIYFFTIISRLSFSFIPVVFQILTAKHTNQSFVCNWILRRITDLYLHILPIC